MNCDCQKNIEEKAKQMGWKGKKVLEASLQGLFAIEPVFEFFTSSTITFKIEGMKREQEIQIRHTYCPFCGNKQNKLKTKGTG